MYAIYIKHIHIEKNTKYIPVSIYYDSHVDRKGCFPPMLARLLQSEMKIPSGVSIVGVATIELLISAMLVRLGNV